MNPYIKLQNRKRTWTPVQPTKGVLKEGAEETIKRALAIRHMELPVGEFISQGLERTVPSTARALLESNVQDEIKHDLALGYIVDAHGADPKSELEAKRLRDAWIEHPDHTITKASLQSELYSLFYYLCFAFLVMLLSEQYQLIYPEMNRSTLRQIVLYVLSWGLFLALVWISFGRQLYNGYYNP